MNAYMKTTKRALAAKRALAVSVFTAMLAIGAVGNAAAQDVRGNGNFNPHVNAPPNYDPSLPASPAQDTERHRAVANGPVNKSGSVAN